ncbi:hypothetical protein [Streptomyces flavotricini]|uniref:hypothetical protein n=1 Tax=Streptomyces flavotricini TaxID=66888 RepID=UPI001E56D7DD|nr:hypothetical protein [Streptomyces flavotricini]
MRKLVPPARVQLVEGQVAVEERGVDPVRAAHVEHRAPLRGEFARQGAEHRLGMTRVR